LASVLRNYIKRQQDMCVESTRNF